MQSASRQAGVAACSTRIFRTLLQAAVLSGPFAATVHAAPPPVEVPTEETLQPAPEVTGPFAFLNNLGRSNYLLGDMWGFRPLLAQYGISFALSETSEVLGNVTGGVRTGAAYDGLTQMLLQLDTNRAFGWQGGLFNVSALQIHGDNLSASNLLTLQTASGIEADRATRLWELWYQQSFLEEDRLDIKIGEQSLDQDFMTSQNAAYFVNTMFGWATVPSYDLPGGGPAYPLAALGARARLRPNDALTFMVGAFNGNPAPRSSIADPQIANQSGLSFPLNGGLLLIAEMQYAYPAIGAMRYADQPEPLPRRYKLGVWFDTADFPDQQYDNTGLSLANPASNGLPLNHHGDFGAYAVADQVVWVDPIDAGHTISLFARVLGAPQADRNLITFSMNAGVVIRQPLPGRADDTFGVGMGYARVSAAAAGLDRMTAAYAGSPTPVRGGETFIEVTYQYQATPWWQLQPDLQYVFNPGGGLANPNLPTQRIGNELVLGLRTNILF